MAYSEIVVKHQRQAVLELLNKQADYTLNSAILQKSLAKLGMSASHSQLITLLHWLEDQGLVDTQKMGGSGIFLASITREGGDIASGFSTHPDIERPAP